MAKTDRRAIYEVCISIKALLSNIHQQYPKQIYNPHLIVVPNPFLPTEIGMEPAMSGTHAS
jgi:hypothetical protein